MTHRFKLRTDAETPAHRTIRVFVNGASAGLLTMRLDEADAFAARIETSGELVDALRETTSALHSTCLIMGDDITRKIALAIVEDARAALSKVSQ